jgi:hypothetical protein
MERIRVESEERFAERMRAGEGFPGSGVVSGRGFE